jgi:LacI family transcriptional regulator, repressor for deo operon, udp, cdd, tsx, nupC, and nupG
LPLFTWVVYGFHRFCIDLHEIADRGRVAGIKDVAKEAGVSTATVSRALRAMQHVNPETRAKILAAAEKLNYAIATHNQPKRANSVGIIAPYLSRWYFAKVIQGAEQALSQAGLDLLVYNINQNEDRHRIFQEEYLKGRIDALIAISLPLNEEEMQAIVDLDIPTALVGTGDKRFASIRIDDVAGARTATQHLVNQGHTRIGLIGGMSNDPYKFPVPRHRKKGFLEVLEESGLEFDPYHEVIGDFQAATSVRAMGELLARRNRPTAIFCESDEMAIGAMHAIKHHGLKVPDDISIVGFDNHEMAEYFDLTTIEQPVQMMGEMAAWSIMEKLKKPDSDMPNLMLPTSLIVRNSTRKITANDLHL